MAWYACIFCCFNWRKLSGLYILIVVVVPSWLFIASSSFYA
uniref:Uncharacterized protein n=1 Tax=Arundo donax TaxID=35708 RepID=A0A0A8YAP9_ARUDO